jgi:putative ABC transport system permease protein
MKPAAAMGRKPKQRLFRWYTEAKPPHMQSREAFTIALQSIWANKLRSFLTILGVVIGIAAVIANVTFVSGLNAYVQEQLFNNLGADIYTISKMSAIVTNADQFYEGQKRKNLTIADYRYYADVCKQCMDVGATAFSFSGSAKANGQAIDDTFIRGWTPSMMRMYDLDVIMGRGITDTDERAGSAVAVIGYDIFDQVFGGMDPIGKEIRVNGRVYQVIGVGKKQGTVLFQSRDNWVLMPITTFYAQQGSANNTSIRIWAKAPGIGATLEKAEDEARILMRARRHDMPGEKDSFSIENNASFMGIWNSISSSIGVVVVGIASISLIIGGIVIMNMMLVSVTERTREIGVRKALGARRNDVLMQFLIEAALLALIGGVLGVAAGVVVAKTVTILIGLPSRVVLWAVAAALIVSSSIGIFFGVYPARRAAMLDPIVALRSEL